VLLISIADMGFFVLLRSRTVEQRIIEILDEILRQRRLVHNSFLKVSKRLNKTGRVIK